MRVGSFRRGEKAGLHYVDFSEGDKHEEPMMTFCELGQELMPEKFLRSQRELREAAKLRAMVTNAEKKYQGWGARKVSKKALRQRLRKRLVHKKQKAEMDEFESEQKEPKGIVNAIIMKVYMVDDAFSFFSFDLRLL